MKLVRNARHAWRWFSMRAMAAAGAVQATWVLLPDDMRASVPANWVAVATIALLVAGTIGRLVDQGTQA
ncbi:hypothetical protein [Pseudogemmobacter sonorensis]|uniref:DUF7940 domain-containing protein n=1 Tax=Pseudogemmobacter sonorensis TaxID=2989681 RepID=UPI00368B9734